jgi:chromate reductase, NAD(P)H dehydrogenase (quinone)
MKKIIAFGASYSKYSINKQLATFAAHQFKNTNIEILDLDTYSVPLFTVDVEAEIGIPENVHRFLQKISEADLLIISMSEHNGSYTAAFKNLFDWTSRLKMNMFEGKKILLISTSPGPRGGIGSLTAAKNRFPIHGGEILSSFSLPLFETNFHAEKGIINEELLIQFQEVIEITKNKILI